MHDDRRNVARSVVLSITAVALSAAAGALLLRHGIEQRDETAAFEQRAVRTRARVVFATETRAARNRPYTKARVGFTSPGGDVGPTFADVTDCPDARIDPDADFVTVLYDPRDERDVRLAGCLGEGANLALFAGAGLLLLALGIVVASVRRRRA